MAHWHAYVRRDDAPWVVLSGGPACFFEYPSRAQVAESLGAQANTSFASLESVSRGTHGVELVLEFGFHKAEIEKLCEGLKEVALSWSSPSHAGSCTGSAFPFVPHGAYLAITLGTHAPTQR